jgi:hypothetical protein
MRAGTWVAALAAFAALVMVDANNRDLFNYDYPNEGVPGGGGTDYGQPDWDRVTCDDLDVCVSPKALIRQLFVWRHIILAGVLTTYFIRNSLGFRKSFSMLIFPRGYH